MNTQKSILLIGDLLIFYLSLFIILFFRYGLLTKEAWPPLIIILFSLVLLIWLAVYWSANLFDIRNMSSSVLGTKMVKTNLINFFLAISFFYFLGSSIAPKRLLALLIVLFGLFSFIERLILKDFPLQKPVTIAFIGSTDNFQKLRNYAQKDSVFKRFPVGSRSLERADIIVFDRTIRDNAGFLQTLYSKYYTNKSIVNLDQYISKLEGQLFLNNVDEAWIIENIPAKPRMLYTLAKRTFDIIFSTLALLIFTPFLPIIFVAITTETGFPIIFKQPRVGLNGKVFTAFKFRTMFTNPPENEFWTTVNDRRVTKVGKFLRKTHLDEIPQLTNVILGDMSLVGPRPEQVGYAEKLSKQIKYYSIRNIAKPGITGWAQLKYKYADSVESSREKFEYELYYLMNRSFSLDLDILIKTLYIIFEPNGR